MKRLNKLYEAKAVVSSAQSKLMLGFIGLKLNKPMRETLGPQAASVSKELARLIETIEGLIEVENMKNGGAE
jgi:hypothetical protein